MFLMAIGGSINRPKTELKKKLFKRRRMLSKGKRKKKKVIGTVLKKAFIGQHLKKHGSTSNIVSGKKRRKLLKQIRHVEKEKYAMEVGVASGSVKTANVMETEPVSAELKGKKSSKPSQDVEMEVTRNVE